MVYDANNLGWKSSNNLKNTTDVRKSEKVVKMILKNWSQENSLPSLTPVARAPIATASLQSMIKSNAFKNFKNSQTQNINANISHKKKCGVYFPPFL